MANATEPNTPTGTRGDGDAFFLCGSDLLMSLAIGGTYRDFAYKNIHVPDEDDRVDRVVGAWVVGQARATGCGSLLDVQER